MKTDGSALLAPRSDDGLVYADDTVAECQGILQRHARSFSAAAVFLTPEMRRDAAVCYAFCRLVDDAVDEAEDLGTAREGLGQIEAMLEGRQVCAPIVASYVALSERLGFGLEPARDLLAGARSDLGRVRFGTDAEFLQYCYRVAGTVGLMMCGVLGVKEAKARRHAIDLGIAMQMTNVCRDVLEDAERDRVYLPETRLRKVGVRQADVVAASDKAFSPGAPNEVRAGVSEVVRGILDWAEVYYESGARGFRFIPERPRLAIMVARSLYREIGETLRSHDCDPFRGRARVSSFRKLFLTVRSAMSWTMGVARGRRGDLELPARLSSK